MSLSKTMRVLIVALCSLFIHHTANAQIGAWTWQSGSNIVDASGNYSAPGAVPGARNGAANWTDSNGNLWLFGGSDDNGSFNDLWEYTPATKTWTFVGGSSNYNQSGSYGTQGQANSANFPGARYQAAFTVDTQGNFWLFGGSGYDSVGSYGYLGDLWEYNVSSGNWTWSGGSEFANPYATYGALGMGSSSFQPAGTSDAALSIDNQGNAWLFGGNTNSGYTNAVWEFSPRNAASLVSTWTWQAGSVTSFFTAPVYNGTPDPGALLNPISWADKSGNLWIFGGFNIITGDSNELWQFNTSTTAWTLQNSTTYTNGQGVYGAAGASSSSNIPGGRYTASGTVDDSGNIWIFGGAGYNSMFYPGYLNDLLTLNSSSNDWTWMTGNDNSYYLNGAYGTPGQPSVNNYPGSRYSSNLWADKNGNIWLFGGVGSDSVGDLDNLNDLWQYNPNTITATPIITPGSETIYVAVNVSITSTTPNAVIYYTTDGSTPITSPTTQTYAGPFQVTSSETVTAIATAYGFVNSAPASATYTMAKYFWAPSTTTFTYGNSLGAVVGLLDATSTAGYNIAYSIHGTAVTASTILTVGQYQLDAIFTSSGGVYSGKISYKITVTPAPLTVTPNPVTANYGGAVPKYTYSITGFVNSDPSTVLTGSPTVYSNASTHPTAGGPVIYTANQGYYTIYTTTGSLKAANYTFIFQTAPLTINPCTCSLTVTPYDANITLGSPIPTSFGYKVTGFIDFDNAASQLTGTAATWTNATSGSGHGYYSIFSGPGTLQQNYNNYAGINYGTATLTIH